ncbi:NAD(P)-dependent oxidoreductase [Burkholderia anthina]|uniref:NAD(P)-dependent oxidoreductase n=1 Tax=Burkholderia anthina TaxID=179879 RepID=UPI001FC82B81|nr:NAD(P)-dependent oxidoreductase [Burkholderia anthina]
MDRHVRNGDWRSGAFPLTTSLSGKRVGIVGMGRIGRGIAERLCPFGVGLSYSGRTQQNLQYRYFPDVRELASHVDILIVSCPGGPATRHLIDAEVLTCLGDQGFLVNVARGSVVDEAALVAALESGVIRGAALDVFESEPLADSRLASLSTTVLAPHAGSATSETRHIMLRMTLDNIHRVLDGQEPLTPVGMVNSREVVGVTASLSILSILRLGWLVPQAVDARAGRWGAVEYSRQIDPRVSVRPSL